MSMKIKILRDRLKFVTDHDMRKHIMKIIKELKAEPIEPLNEKTFVERLNQLTEDIK